MSRLSRYASQVFQMADNYGHNVSATLGYYTACLHPLFLQNQSVDIADEGWGVHGRGMNVLYLDGHSGKKNDLLSASENFHPWNP